ncbi:hypothetical protein MMYC01_201723 [Madurella mycetomatis]|uniref:TauD/TfdA-like domain-containing protein n=1 Tax=Madurella mycetomatis TaxID=100816 RepID=A0A175WDA4_9PEZI|nr:hypothetical protein MMYC01_205146 [Madurella mycetomatis]KXX81481.1 hypothetical protein MMYC01_201723 [Madurella mycetomatis]
MACPLLSNTQDVLPTAKDPSDEVVRPDISWIPSYKVFIDRVEKLKDLYPNRPTTVPAGWPAQVNAARAWDGSDFNSEGDYVLILSDEDVMEIEAGLEHFKRLPGELGPDDVCPETFPLPNMASRLGRVSEIIHDGRGFVVLRGLQPDKYTMYDNILLYLGVTSYIAEKRGMQDFDGRMILHIQAVLEDIKKHGSMPNSPYVARAQPFHTDLCDVLALYALNVAAYGGESFLASSAKIYNELAKTRPDIIEVLAKDDWVFDEFWEGQYHTRPLLYNFESHGPAFQFSRRPLTGSHFSPHHPKVPAMTELQAEALDAVYFLAKEHALEIRLQRGDMLLFNNFAMLHARSGFADDEARGMKRHMLRLWLRNEERMWKTPRQLERISWECYGDNEWRRQLRVWDIDRSPPELRVNHRRASCA